VEYSYNSSAYITNLHVFFTVANASLLQYSFISVYILDIDGSDFITYKMTVNPKNRIYVPFEHSLFFKN